MGASELRSSRENVLVGFGLFLQTIAENWAHRSEVAQQLMIDKATAVLADMERGYWVGFLRRQVEDGAGMQD
jgi:hypothetical protein